MHAPNLDIVHVDVNRALQEDLATGDINAELIDANASAEARVITRERCVLAGSAWADQVFQAIEPGVKLRWHFQDGDQVPANAALFHLHAKSRTLLSGERSALNFIQTLSATATQTARYVALIAHTKTKLLDTRKTIPGLRYAQKYAVLCGGGHNHRMGLFDAFLIKENHIAAAGGSIGNAVRQARTLHPERFLQVEVETETQLAECVQLKVPRVLLDNFSPARAHAAVLQFGAEIELEASGGIDDQSLVAYAQAGVHFISVGSLTKHVRAIDLSMRFV
jgi:nicotinate-nucleotide pyrophosphorylase (carboxylating)